MLFLFYNSNVKKWYINSFRDHTEEDIYVKIHQEVTESHEPVICFSNPVDLSKLGIMPDQIDNLNTYFPEHCKD